MALDFEKLKRFTSELKRLLPNYGYTFKCPFCFRDFSNDDIVQRKVIDAHIIPESLGGRTTTIACYECDNRIGTAIEGPAINWTSDIEIMTGKRTGKIRGGKTYLRTQNRNYKVEILANKKNQVVINIPNPNDYAYFLEHDVHNIDKSQRSYDWSERVTDEQLAQFYLKMAYLAAFDKYGYKYIYHSELNWIRCALASKAKYHIPYKFFFTQKGSLLDSLPVALEFGFCPMKIQSWIAPMFFWKAGVVFLPPFRSSNSKQFDGFGLESKKQHRMTLSCDDNDNLLCGELTFVSENQVEANT